MSTFADELLHSKDDGAVVQFVHQILVRAIELGASDVHFEPYENEYRIRYRQDGLLNQVASPPLHLSPRIAARIKVMANLDISEKRVPQDGRFKMQLSNKSSIDCRVSSCPTVAGEKIVVRLFDPETTKLDVDALGFSPSQKTDFLQAIQRPQGMVLVTGPTGSGKTVTLYTALTSLNTLEKNISTAEDPVEIKIAGINQVNIHPKAGLTFARVLRAFLRQDPDIIMVGEMRDLETAEIAVKAAQTGHLVLSTLHTNSAAETLTRLLNIGIPAYLIASSVSLIIAQRLLRRLCEHCKIVSKEHPQLYNAVGCEHCSNGYNGRIGVFELMPMSTALAKMMVSDYSSEALLKQAQSEGMLSIYQTGIEKVKQGITSMEELHRVAS